MNKRLEKTLEPIILGGMIIFLGVLFLIDKRDETVDNLLLAVIRACILGSFTVIYIYTPERFDTKIRSTAMGMLVAGSRVGSMICPFISVNLPEHGFVKLPFLIYAIIGLVATVASLCLKLETTGLSMDNIEMENKKMNLIKFLLIMYDFINILDSFETT